MAKRRVVVLGAGFGGSSAAIACARHLRSRDNAEVVLVDQHRLHTYTPLLYEVASGGLRACVRPNVLTAGAAIDMSVEGMLVDHVGVSMRRERVTGVDAARRRVQFQSGKQLAYDALILALGAVSNTFGVVGVEEHAFFMKTIDDALRIHARICALLDDVRAGRTDAMHAVVVGGGPTGVEYAAELAMSLRAAQRVGAVPSRWSVTLVDSAPRVLSMLAESISHTAHARLRALGVRVLTCTLVKEIGHAWVVAATGDKPPSSIEADLVVWTGGVKADAQWASWGLSINERGYVVTDAALRVKGMRDVFAIGDMAAVGDERLPQIAPEAIWQGRLAAQNVARALRGEPLREYRAPVWPWAIPLGGRRAIAHWRGVTVNGFMGYVFRKLVDLNYFFSVLRPWHALRVWWRGGWVYLQNE